MGCIINWSEEALQAIAAHAQSSDDAAGGCLIQWDAAKLESELGAVAAHSAEPGTAEGGCIIDW